MASRRKDGRDSDQLRPILVEFAGLARVDGSCRFGFGKVPTTLASISGPIEVRLAAEQASQATLEVHVRPVSGVASTESKVLSSTIASILLSAIITTKNPRTLIQIVTQSLWAPASHSHRWKDGLVASMVNASVLALLNSGSIPLRGVVCAVSVGKPRGTAGFIVDPAEEELESLDGGGCFAFLFSDGQVDSAECIWSSWHTSSLSGARDAEILQVTSTAATAAREVWLKIKEAIRISEGGHHDEAEMDDAKMEL